MNNTTLQGNDSSHQPDPPLVLSPIQQWSRIFVITFALPLTFLVAFVILRSWKQLWSSLHLIFRLAIVCFNCMGVIQFIFELIISYLHQFKDSSHVLLYKFYLNFYGIPFNLLLSGLALASCECYLAIQSRQFYQRYATAKSFGCVLFGTVIFVIGGQTMSLWIGFLPIEFNSNWTLVANHCYQGTLSALCLFILIRLVVFNREEPHSNNRTGVQQNPYFSDSLSSDSGDRNEMNIWVVPIQTAVAVFPISYVDGRLQTVNDVGGRSSEWMRSTKILCWAIFPFCQMTLILSLADLVQLVADNYRLFDTTWFSICILNLREFMLIHYIHIPTVFAVFQS